MSSAAGAAVPSWATVDPTKMGSTAEPYAVSNLVGGKWTKAKDVMTIPHPMDKAMHPIFTIPDTQVSELGPFLESMQKVPKSGVHNPLKNPDRYVQYGEISRKVCFTRSQHYTLECVSASAFERIHVLFFMMTLDLLTFLPASFLPTLLVKGWSCLVITGSC